MAVTCGDVQPTDSAEVGTQSGKARKAKEFGKPVFSADEYFAWLGTDL